ncbi:MAG: MYXO-CTERM sorting domain-containing protein [Kofleriaceae bacterium]
MARVLGLLFAAALVAGQLGPAHANGRFPRTVKVVFQPGDPQVVALGATFGLLVSSDGGATWRWICESAVGFAGTFDPDYELSPSGAIFATTFDGLKVLRDGCTWQPVPGPLGTTFVSAVAVGPDGTIWAGTSDSVLGSALYKSTDDGVTFTPTAMVGQLGDWWNSIEVAPSDPQRVVVTAFRLANAQPRERLLFRTDDGGARWDPLPTTAFVGTNNSDLDVAAIDPADPDHVFIRMTNAGPTLSEALFVSTDVGAAAPTWTRVLDVADNLTGVVVRPGGEVLAATPSLGLQRSTDGGATFAPVPGVTLEGRCLAQRPDGQLWMCTNNLPPDGAAIHVSATGAAGSWTRLFGFSEIVGPVRCAAGTVQHDDCELVLWCGLQENLGITSTEIDCQVAPPDAGIDATTGGGGGGKGCCSTGGSPGLELPLAGLGLAGLVRRRRRRGQPGGVRAVR